MRLQTTLRVSDCEANPGWRDAGDDSIAAVRQKKRVNNIILGFFHVLQITRFLLSNPHTLICITGGGQRQLNGSFEAPLMIT